MNDRVCRSLLEWFLHRSETTPDRTVLWIPEGDGYRTLNWSQWRADVLRGAAALAGWGVRPGDQVVQLSENRYEWLVADLALQCVQAIHVPLHAPLSARQIAHEIKHSGASFVLASTSEQLAKLQSLLNNDDGQTARPSGSLRVWSYDRCPFASRPFAEQVGLSCWADELNGADESLGDRLARQAVAAARPDHLLKILYTSGTTGQSKGVLLTQGNLLFNAQALAYAYGARPHERKLNFLALSHVFAQTNDFYSTLVAGCELALARSRETVLDDCQSCRPTLINGVPSFYQRVVRTLREAQREHATGALRQLLGGRLELCNAGGAPLPDPLHEYFYSQGIPLLQGYGLTETSPVISVSTPSADRRGCVGRPLTGVEVQIAADGEILTRGPHVSPGYFHDDEATSAALRDGWFHTGDLGEQDADGFLRITGRKKEMIVLANGRKVPPLAIEAALLADPLFQQAIVLGDGRNHLVALVRLDAAERACRESREVARSESDPQVPASDSGGQECESAARQFVFERIRRALMDRAPWEQIQAFYLLPEPLSIERGELTAKLSLRRDVIARRYAQVIDDLYGER